MDPIAIIKVFTLTTASFAAALIVTPLWASVLYRYKLGKSIRDQASAPIMAKLHAHKAGTPTMGGVIIWGTTLIVALGVWVIASYTGSGLFAQLNFLTRPQTWLPLGAFIASAAVGLADDFLNVYRIGPHGGGLQLRHKLLLYFLIALVGAWWFYFRLEWDVIHVPFLGDHQIGAWYIPFFILVIVGTAFSVNQTDGLDGLAGGTLAAAFAAYAAIAFSQGRYDLATLCGVIVGALLAFLWFNIPPARFFMGDTGSMSLGVTLGIVALLTNAALLLPVIGIVFVAEAFSTIAQLLSKKIRKKKIFISSPLHHHLEALGWPESKIVMRAWVISAVTAVGGVIISLSDLIR